MVPLMDIPNVLKPRLAVVAWSNYAALSYLYYVKNESVVPDHEFDYLCRWILANYDWIKTTDLNGYLEREALEAGTGYNIASRVTGMTKDYAEDILKAYRGKKVAKHIKPDRIAKSVISQPKKRKWHELL